MNEVRTGDDIATEREEQFLNHARAQRKREGPVPCGYCHNCSERVTGNQRWCDEDCRDDWEKRERNA